MLRKWLEPWRAYNRIRKLPRSRCRLVVYSEGGEYGIFFRPIFNTLIDDYGLEFLFVTSDAADPLINSHPEVEAFCVGLGAARTAFFQNLQADMVLMTVPDLGRFHLKRSANAGHYAYVHHSVVSTHMAYRLGAFDHYDSILCVGPHHVTETRAWEAKQKLPAKQLVPHGYGPIDILMKVDTENRLSRRDRPTILVAPSWGKDGLIETGAGAVCRSLLDAGLRVVLRPHPRTLKNHRQTIDELSMRLGADSNFVLDLGRVSHEIYREADIMVSDWSGAAFEFAFGLLRPVLFVDVPRKVNNPQYDVLQCEPLEARLRSRVGAIVTLDSLAVVGHKVEELLSNLGSWRERIMAERAEWIFNPGRSGSAAAEFITRHLGVSRRRSEPSDTFPIAGHRSLKDRVRDQLFPCRGGVESLLAQLLERAVLGWSREDIAVLHQLARKVEVSKGLHSTYGDGWSRPAVSGPLDPGAWPAVVLVFLLAAEQTGENYKFLNAALRALDLMDANGVTLFAGELRHGCLKLLDRVDS